MNTLSKHEYRDRAEQRAIKNPNIEWLQYPDLSLSMVTTLSSSLRKAFWKWEEYIDCVGERERERQRAFASDFL